MAKLVSEENIRIIFFRSEVKEGEAGWGTITLGSYVEINLINKSNGGWFVKYYEGKNLLHLKKKNKNMIS